MVEFPYVRITVGNVDITPTPAETLKSFEYTRVTEGKANKLEFTLYDDSAVALEAELVRGASKCTFSYGLTPQSAKSYQATILDYSLSFKGLGAELVVSGISTGVIEGTGETTKYYDGTPTEVITRVAAEEKWQLGNLEPTHLIQTIDPNTKQYIPKKYYRNNKRAVDFIKEDVLPFARSLETNLAGFTFYFKDGNGGSVVNFHTPSYKAQSYTANSFIVGDKNSHIMSFTPTYSGAAMIASGISVSGTDPAGTGFSVSSGKGYKTISVSAAVKSPVEAKVYSDYLWQCKLREVYNGEMVLINTPNIPVMNVINVIVLNKSGVAHHSSGLYVVLEVVDTIENGHLISTLKLMGVNA